MASVVVTLKIMPKSPEVDLDKIADSAKKEIDTFSNSVEIKVEKEPIAFGLVALKIMFIMPEEKGTTDELENTIKGIEGVNSVECIDVRRAIG